MSRLTELPKVLVCSVVLLGACGSGPNILMLLEKQYWRIDDLGPDGKWRTNWIVWFETEDACLEQIDESQRCRKRRL